MRVYSIFNSISGEAGPVPQGTPTTFVRLTGCNQRCAWCDTKKTWSPDNGEEMSVPQVIAKVKYMGLQSVLFTGGEPLLQAQELSQAIRALDKLGHTISIETNGTLPLDSLKLGFTRVNWVVDYKLNSAALGGAVNPYEFARQLRQQRKKGHEVMVKFVCQDRGDFEQAMELCHNDDMAKLIADCKIDVAFSPASPLLPQDLAKWILEEELWWVIFSLQIHKVIWPGGEAEK